MRLRPCQAGASQEAGSGVAPYPLLWTCLGATVDAPRITPSGHHASCPVAVHRGPEAVPTRTMPPGSSFPVSASGSAFGHRPASYQRQGIGTCPEGACPGNDRRSPPRGPHPQVRSSHRQTILRPSQCRPVWILSYRCGKSAMIERDNQGSQAHPPPPAAVIRPALGGPRWSRGIRGCPGLASGPPPRPVEPLRRSSGRHQASPGGPWVSRGRIKGTIDGGRSCSHNAPTTQLPNHKAAV